MFCWINPQIRVQLEYMLRYYAHSGYSCGGLKVAMNELVAYVAMPISSKSEVLLYEGQHITGNDRIHFIG